MLKITSKNVNTLQYRITNIKNQLADTRGKRKDSVELVMIFRAPSFILL